MEKCANLKTNHHHHLLTSNISYKTFLRCLIIYIIKIELMDHKNKILVSIELLLGANK